MEARSDHTISLVSNSSSDSDVKQMSQQRSPAAEHAPVHLQAPLYGGVRAALHTVLGRDSRKVESVVPRALLL